MLLNFYRKRSKRMKKLKFLAGTFTIPAKSYFIGNAFIQAFI